MRDVLPESAHHAPLDSLPLPSRLIGVRAGAFATLPDDLLLTCAMALGGNSDSRPTSPHSSSGHFHSPPHFEPQRERSGERSSPN